MTNTAMATLRTMFCILTCVAAMFGFVASLCAHLPQLDASVYVDPGAALASNGRLIDALTVTHDTVHAYRTMHAKYPDIYQPYLAASLSDLSQRFQDVGLNHLSMTTMNESVALFRELAHSRPDFASKLAVALYNLSFRLWATRRPHEAAITALESRAMFRSLLLQQQKVETAYASYSLGYKLIDMGMAAVYQNRTTNRLYRELRTGRESHVAAALLHLGNHLTTVEQITAALLTVDDALELYTGHVRLLQCNNTSACVQHKVQY